MRPWQACGWPRAGCLCTRLCGRGHDIGVAELRKIIHVDMDAFYAAIEQRDDPSAARSPDRRRFRRGRGVVMTASYEARRVRRSLGDALGSALRLCPELLFVRAALRRLQAREPQDSRDPVAHSPI